MKRQKITSMYLALIIATIFIFPYNTFGQTGMQFLRTPDIYFSNLPGYNFTPHYAFVDDYEGGQLRMHYIDEGPQNAPTVLLLHGNPTWSYMFRDVIVRLNSAGYRTIAIDYIGMGRSDKPTDFDDYTYDRHVGWTAQMFQYLDSTLNLGSLVIFGHDYGTPIGIRLMNEFFPIDLMDLLMQMHLYQMEHIFHLHI
jgi:haloalkane dehalogenase